MNLIEGHALHIEENEDQIGIDQYVADEFDQGVEYRATVEGKELCVCYLLDVENVRDGYALCEMVDGIYMVIEYHPSGSALRVKMKELAPDSSWFGYICW